MGTVLKCVMNKVLKGTWRNQCPQDDNPELSLTKAEAGDLGSSTLIDSRDPGKAYNPWGPPAGGSSRSPSVGDGTKPFPGIGYLGLGYDITHSNPQGNGKSLLDPGYRSPVIQLNYEKDAKHSTADLSFLVPTQGFGIKRVACQHATTSTKMSSMEDYSKSVASDASQDTSVSAGFSGFGAAVSGSYQGCSSEGTQEFAQNVVTGDSERFEMKSYCTQYRVLMDRPYSKLALSDYFNAHVAKLPRWDVVTVGGCAKHFCSHIFFSEIERYLVVQKNFAVELQEKPPQGKWLFSDDDHLVYWLTGDPTGDRTPEQTLGDNKWKFDRAAKVLTRGEKTKGDTSVTKLTMQAKAKGTQDDLLKRQIWTYTTNQKLTSSETVRRRRNRKHGSDSAPRETAIGVHKTGQEVTPAVVWESEAPSE